MIAADTRCRHREYCFVKSEWIRAERREVANRCAERGLEEPVGDNPVHVGDRLPPAIAPRGMIRDPPRRRDRRARVPRVRGDDPTKDWLHEGDVLDRQVGPSRPPG